MSYSGKVGRKELSLHSVQSHSDVDTSQHGKPSTVSEGPHTRA